MNIGLAGFSSGWNRQYTTQGQMEQLQLLQQQQEIETGKQQQALNALTIQQKTTQLQQDKATQEAMIAGYRKAQESVNNPIDSQGNVSGLENVDTSAMSPLMIQQIRTLNAQANELFQKGLPGGDVLLERAEALKKDALLEQDRQEKVKKEKTNDFIQALNPVKDQESYNRFLIGMMQQKADLRQFLPNLTFNWEKDKDSINDLRDRSITAYQKLELEGKAKADDRADKREARAQQDENRRDREENRRIASERNRDDRLNRKEALDETKQTESKRKDIIKRENSLKLTYHRDYLAKQKELSKLSPDDVERHNEVVDEMNTLTDNYKEDRQRLEDEARLSGFTLMSDLPKNVPSKKEAGGTSIGDGSKYLKGATSQQDFNRRVQELLKKGWSEKQIRDAVK